MNYKNCSKCRKKKFIHEFSNNKNTKDGLQTYCRPCMNSIVKIYRDKNKEKLVAKATESRKEYQRQWIVFFKQHYGTTPSCECCGKILRWRGPLPDIVCFDHRFNGAETIDRSPKQWINVRPCNDNYIKTFLSCNFGILCGLCNIRMPTENRIEWLQKATEYAKRAVS